MHEWLLNLFDPWWKGMLCCFIPVVLTAGMGTRVYFTDAEPYGGWGGWKGKLNCAHTILFNISGSAAGWVLLWAGLYRATRSPNLSELGWIDLLLFLLSFIGITGHLPMTAHGLVKSVGRLADAAEKKISG